MRMAENPMVNGKEQQERCGKSNYFQLPLNYPRNTKTDYETMPEWKLNFLLAEYGLPVKGNLAQKRSIAMSTSLWPD